MTLTIQEKFISYAKRTTIAAVILTSALLALRYGVVANETTITVSQAVQIIISFYGICLWVGYTLIKANAEKTGRAWVTFFTIITIVKMALYLTIVLICLFVFPENTRDLLVVFATCYIVFSFVERAFLMKDLRAKTQGSN